MPLDWSPFVDLVRRHQRFVLTTHVRPDGDGLGSMLALADVLEAPPLAKTVRMTVASALPPRYDFLDPARRVRRFEPPGDAYRDADAAIVLDTGTWNQLGEFGTFLRSLPIAKAVIDHHLTQDDLGALRLVDTTAEATGRLVHEAILALGGPLPASAAHCLFVALAMDTGWFRHNNTTPATFTLAADLVRGRRRADRSLRMPVRAEHAGPSEADGPGAGAVASDARRPSGAHGGPPRRLRLDGRGAAGQRGSGQLHAQSGRRGGRSVLHGAAARRREGQLPLAACSMWRAWPSASAAAAIAWPPAPSWKPPSTRPAAAS